MTAAARYRFGEPGRIGVVLGMSLRQTVPVVAGVIWLTLMMVVRLPIVGAIGPVAGLAVALGRWKRAPLYEVAGPGAGLAWRRLIGKSTWRRRSLPSHPVVKPDMPAALHGLAVVESLVSWDASTRAVGIIHDRPAATLSIVVSVSGGGFSVASPLEQDALVSAWGAALSPVARARCPISRITWQEWCHPVGVDGHRRFLASSGSHRIHEVANDDYTSLLDEVGPFTVAHDVHVTGHRRFASSQGTPR